MNSQPLLRISLLALLLPLTLSCDRKNPLTDVAENYKTIVQTDLNLSVSSSIYFSMYSTILPKMETPSLSPGQRQGLTGQLDGLMPSNGDRDT